MAHREDWSPRKGIVLGFLMLIPEPEAAVSAFARAVHEIDRNRIVPRIEQ